jgi:chromosome segregation ATPase
MADDDPQTYVEDASLASIQAVLKELRDKTFRAAGVIRDLKEQLRSAEQRATQSETTLHDSRQRLEEKERELRHMQKELAERPSLDVADKVLYFSADEREALERQISDLLVRVQSHLG